MIVQIDESLKISFNTWNLQNAKEAIDKIKSNHRDRADDVLDGVFSLLLFAQLEKRSKGLLASLAQDGTQISEWLNPPKASDE